MNEAISVTLENIKDTLTVMISVIGNSRPRLSYDYVIMYG